MSDEFALKITVGMQFAANVFCDIQDVIVDGKTGFLVKDLREFVEKAVYLFQNDDIRKEMGKNAKKYADHKIENIAQIWIKIYEKLIRMYPYKGGKEYQELFMEIWKNFALNTPGVQW